MAVPNTFQTATSAIPLANLDANFTYYDNAFSISGTATTFTGTATATKLIPTGSSATGNGLYLPAANSVGLSTNGTNAVYIDSSQNVGIGTSSPSQRLDVVTTTAAGLRVATSTSTASTASLYLVVANNFSGTSQAYIQCIGSGASGVSQLAFATARAAADTTATEAMRIDSSGNVGIGTTSPNYLIDSQTTSTTITTNLKVNASAAANNYAEIAFQLWNGAGSGLNTFGGSGTSRPSVVLRGLSEGSGATGAFVVATFGGGATNATLTEKMRIDSSGNLLVGTTTAVAKLTVEQTGANANGANIVNQTYNHPTLGLHNTATSGDNFLVAFTTDASSFRGSISYNRAGGLVAYNTTSDYRAKDISGPVTGSGALIDSTPVYMGKMKDATQERPMFIAHETPAYAHTGVKDAVDADGNPVYQQMDASALIPVMWAEIQSLRKRLTALEST